MERRVYDPLSNANLGANITLALLQSEALSLADHSSKAFAGGGGVYAVYYSGSCPIYRLYKRYNLKHAKLPIYVGKAMAASTLTGLQGFRDSESNYALSERVWEHHKTIRGMAGPCPYPLDINDFTFRHLSLGDSHVTLAEAALMTFLRPLWNGSGFGNHVPGGGRKGKRVPPALRRAHSAIKPVPSELEVREIRQRIVDQVKVLRRRREDDGLERVRIMINAVLDL